MELVFSKFADADMLEIRDYTRRTHGAKQAVAYVEALREGMKLLTQFPEIGLMSKNTVFECRCYQIKHHRAYYRISESCVTIIAVLHESRLPDRFLEQRQFE